jgi:hypothetical protein
VKKETVEVVETSGWWNVVKPQATKECQKWPGTLKGSQNEAQKFFEFSRL